MIRFSRGVKPRFLTLCFAAIAAVTGASGADAKKYSFDFIGDQPFSTPGTTRIEGINNSGRVVGYSDGGNFDDVEFTYAGGTFDTPFSSLPNDYANSGEVYGINNIGSITGTYQQSYFDGTGYSYRQAAYLYDGTNFNILPNPPSFPQTGLQAPLSVNDLQQIAGAFLDADGNLHGYVYSSGAYTQLDHPNTAYFTESTAASGINNAGVIVGSFSDTNFLSFGHGFIYEGGVYTDLDYAGARDTSLFAINNMGVAVGSYLDDVGTFGDHHGFVYDHGSFDVIDDSMFPGGSVDTFLIGINDSGQVAGYYYDEAFTTHSFIATPQAGGVPEPASWAMMLGGFGLAGAAMRRNRTIARFA